MTRRPRKAGKVSRAGTAGSRPRRRRWLAAFAALLLLVAGAAAGLYVWAEAEIHTPFKACGGDGQTVVVEAGSGVARIFGQLEQAGVIRHRLLARLYLEAVLGNPPLQAGEYRFEGPLALPAVLDKLVRGSVVTYAVTLVEGLTLEEQAAHLAAEGFGDEADFLAAMRRPAPIADLDPAAVDLEGYLFPDTYHFPRGASEETIVATLAETFRRVYERELRAAIAAGPRSLREVVTLASIVEKEARQDAERPLIAGVYANRLAQGIALYADPTVIFALKRLGRWDGNLRRPDLQLDSPYNTYRYPGLPPGPIASAGKKSLLAAAVPAQVPYLYFVSRNDGTHLFARTLEEHNRNVHEWQKLYWRRRWAAETK